jgi:hypothetical protein
MVGQPFGQLVVLGPAPPTPGGMARWRCVCLCGRVVVRRQDNLRSGNVTSCGCRKRQRRRQLSPHRRPTCTDCAQALDGLLRAGEEVPPVLLCPACLARRVDAVLVARQAREAG